MKKKKKKNKNKTYLSAGNVQLNLALVRAHQSAKLLDNTLQQTQSVVLSKRGKEVLEDFALVGAAGNSLQLLHDLLLVAHGQSGGVEDDGEFGILFEDVAERGEGLGNLVEGRGFGRGSVLRIVLISKKNKHSFSLRLQLPVFHPVSFNTEDFPSPN